MSTASYFYEMDDVDDHCDVESRAKDAAEFISKQTLGGVAYETCVFKDGSKLTFGSNGYIGMEEKA